MNTIYLVEPFNFTSDPPFFTLVADTRGGPPTRRHWSRNDNVLRNRSATHISPLKVNGVNTLDVESVSHVLRESRYRSTLTVTGHLPGIYKYSATNVATFFISTSRFFIYGITRS